MTHTDVTGCVMIRNNKQTTPKVHYFPQNIALFLFMFNGRLTFT